MEHFLGGFEKSTNKNYPGSKVATVFHQIFYLPTDAQENCFKKEY